MKKYSLHIIALLGLIMFATACSNQKNTSGTRFYHAMTARFNTYFNGMEAFKEGVTSQQSNHVDNYTELLPINIVTNKATAETGKSNFETAITKCEKAIKEHSIKARPKTNVNKRKTAKEKAYLARKEFNPFLKHAWLLMGKAQFRKGEFIEAASTFNYIIHMYAGQPDVVSLARAWMARCYIAMEWPYDAEDIFNKIKRDSITSEGMKEYNLSYTDYLILTKQFKEAVPRLEKAIKSERNRKQKARMNFLLGQLHQINGNNKEAYKAFKKVIRSNPPYVLAFNARIRLTETMSEGNHSKTIKKLQRMARNKKNKDYLDQIYYAIGNIYLANNDTARCIGAYEKGRRDSERSGISKAMLLLKLGEVYWTKEDYIHAQYCYSEAVGMLNKEHDLYKETERRAGILTELEPHLSAIKLQDSLQALAKMPENERNAAIDRVIEELKRKEKEEAKKEAAANAAQNTGSSLPNIGNNMPNVPNMANGRVPGNNNANGNAVWYFYNPSVVAQGKLQFARTWGKRKLEDNWRISNKQDIRNDSFEEYDYSEMTEEEIAAMQDSINRADSLALAQEALADSLSQDPHHREYYMQQIPFTEEQLSASNAILMDALYKAGIVEIEKLENFRLGLNTLNRLINDFPEITDKDKVYYYQFLVCGRLEMDDEASDFRNRLIQEFPESKYAVMLSNPNYELYARRGKQIEDSLYAATYQAYKDNDYNEVFGNCAVSEKDFPEGAHRAKFMFTQAMSELYSGKRKEFLETLKKVIEKYPEDEITEMAKFIVKGVEEGKSLSDGKYNASDIWSRRTGSGLANDSTSQADTLSNEILTNFVFLLAYPENSLDEDQLLFEMAKYNFTSFMVRNFDIEIVKSDGLAKLQISGFLNFDEAHAYAQKLYADPHMSKVLENIRSVIISQENLKLLGSAFSFDEYSKFYEENLAPYKVPEDLILDESPSLEIRTEEEYPEDYNNEGYNDNGNYNNEYLEEEETESGIIF